MNRSEGPAGPDEVVTRMTLPGAPAAVWERLMFYEDVPSRPWLLLRWLLPKPLRSEGDKRTAGSLVRCTYDRGHLLKRITVVEPARLLRFDVVEQHLGIESRVRAVEGSYRLESGADGTEVWLTTKYQGRLWPRPLWRLLERWLGHRLHGHILLGMRVALASAAGPTTPGGAADPADSSAVPTR